MLEYSQQLFFEVVLIFSCLFVFLLYQKVEGRLSFGEEVRVVGNITALGLNNPRNAIPLVTSSDKFPMWGTQNGLLLPNSSLLLATLIIIFVSYHHC
jgi:hypothetical protein